MRHVTRLAIPGLAILLPATVTGRQPVAIEALTLETPRGTLTATARVPAAPGGPPLVLIVTNRKSTGTPGSLTPLETLASRLATREVASTMVVFSTPGPPGRDGAHDVDRRLLDTAAWIGHLRNDGRFPRVIVAGLGDSAVVAAQAARAARADGFVRLRSNDPASSVLDAEIARLRVPVLRLDHPRENQAGVSDEESIARFARDVPAFGWRGSWRPRPAEPRRSPRTTTVGLIDDVLIALEYGQPSKRGRTIWDGLVPWGRVWMPGADESTTLTTSGPVTIGGLKVPDGDHTLYTLPSADAFTLIVSKDVGQFHTVFDERLVLGRTAMTQVKRSDVAERLTFALVRRAGGGGLLELIWDDRAYSVPIVVNPTK